MVATLAMIALARFLAALHAEYPDVVNLDDFRRGSATQQWDALLGCQPAPGAQEVAAHIPATDLQPASVVAVQLPLFGTSAQPVHCVVHAVAPGAGVQGPEVVGVVQTVWHSRAGPA